MGLENKIKNEEELNNKVNDLEKLIRYKDKLINEQILKIENLNEKMLQLEEQNNNNYDNNKIKDLSEKLEMKESEIKEIKSKLPIVLSKKENLMIIIFSSIDEEILYPTTGSHREISIVFAA